MGITITAGPGGHTYDGDEPLYVDAAGKVTTDPAKGVVFLGNPGNRIPAHLVDRYDLATQLAPKPKKKAPAKKAKK